MYCQKCGTQNPDDATFCSKCGNGLNSTIKSERNAGIKPKERNIGMCILYTIITLGIYVIYWFYSTKNEMVELGADIPTFWLAIIPIVNIYWLYKYYVGLAQVTNKSKDTALIYFILYIVFSPAMLTITQVELNKLAK
jgi:predicted nucleic acid-binding Zn ribbon protein